MARAAWHHACEITGSGGGPMRNFLAAVLSVIAVGVLLIAYGLLSPRVAAADVYPFGRPTFANARTGDTEDLTLRQPRAYAVSEVRSMLAYDVVRRVPADDLRYASVRSAQSVTTRPAPRRSARASGRDWRKTAMVIGGSTAAGAGLGAIFGGKKGALIGAALGGGAGTLFEVKNR
jgi:uncharacterized protein YcfJ